jgi:uncharacterized protein
VVRVGQKVQVTVLEVDLTRRRIGLSLKAQPVTDTGRTPRSASADLDRRPHPASPRAQGESTKPASDWFSLALRKAAQDKARRRAAEEN